MERHELSEVLRELVELETGETCPDLDDATDLRHGLNLDSLDMVTLVFRIENRLRIEIKGEELGQLANVGDFLDLLQAKLASAAARKAA